MVEYQGISVSKKSWSDSSDEFMENVFKFYKERGFPFFPIDDTWRKEELRKMFLFYKKHGGSMWKGNSVKQTMHGLSFCWSFHPHSFGVKCNDLLSPLEAFEDDNIFRSVVAKRMRMGDNMSDSGIRKMLKIHSGVQGVSNFRPTAAAAIYDKYCPENGIVYDMSMGYSGRLLGAMLSKNVFAYIGTDPCVQNFDGSVNVINFLRNNNFIGNKMVITYNKCSEDLDNLDINSVDFCFTSPPYFNTEKYSEEETQSWKRYSEKEEWVENFLGKTFFNCKKFLKDNGVMAINIANVRSFNNLEEETVRVAENSGFKLTDTKYLELSSLSKKSKFKKEPIFIFRKVS